MRLIIHLWKKLLVFTALCLAVCRLPQVHRISKFFQPLHRKWIAISHTKRGIIVGIAIALATNVFQDAEAFRKMEDAGLDWMIQMYRGVPRPAKTGLHPVTFLDIDERSYRHWGEPLSIPRDKLLKLIRYAVDGQASLIIVDVELSRPSGAHDTELKEYLASISKQKPKPPEILLARGLRFPLDKDHGLFEQRPSFLDDVVAQNPHLHWAAPLYQLEDDAVIRRWRLWEATCLSSTNSGEQKVVGLPSFQLLATSLLKDQNAASILQAAFHPHLPASCDRAAKSDAHGDEGKVTLSDLTFSLDEEDMGRRILYSLPRRLRDGETYPTIHWQNDSDYPLFSIKPAVVITEVISQAPPDLTGHVVVIGASYADSRDIYFTPLNAMPGTMIIVNAFLSFLQNGEASEPPRWAKLIIEAVLIVVVALIFARLHGILAKVVASIVTLMILLPASFWLFRSGLWLDFAIPLAAVEFHAMVGEMEEKLGRHHPPQSTQ